MTDVSIAPDLSPPGQVPVLSKPPTMLEKMQPQTFDELIRFAVIVARANWAPASYKVGQKFDEDKILIAMMQGMELGLPALMSVQSIAVINGMPSIYGDAMLAVVERSGKLEDFRETPILNPQGKVVGYKTYAKRLGRPTPIETKFDLADATRANLIGKSGPWTQYESRMFQFRSRSLCLRDGFSDVLKGLTSVEEAQDITIVSNTPVEGVRAKSITGKLDAFAGTSKLVETDAEFTDTHDDDGVVFEAPEMPVDLSADFKAERYQAYLPWLATELTELDARRRQIVADDQAANLRLVRAVGEGPAAMVDKLVTNFGISVDFDGAA